MPETYRAGIEALRQTLAAAVAHRHSVSDRVEDMTVRKPPVENRRKAG